MTSAPTSDTRGQQLERALAGLLQRAPQIEAAAVVSFDGLPMASALPSAMDEDRVAAMSAALLSLGERAAEGLGRGELHQVYIEGDRGTVFLVSADDEAVLVAVAAQGAKAGLMLYEVKITAGEVAAALTARAPDGQAPSAAAVPSAPLGPPTASAPDAPTTTPLPPAASAPAPAPPAAPPVPAAVSAWDSPPAAVPEPRATDAPSDWTSYAVTTPAPQRTW